MILICNNFVNSAAAAIVTVIALSFGGERMPRSAVGLFTVVLIVFGEVAPKTFGALYPERIALPAAVVFTVLLKVLYPIVWLTNLVANGVLRVLGCLAREGEPHVAELGGTAHRRRRGEHRDSASSPAHADEHPRPREASTSRTSWCRATKSTASTSPTTGTRCSTQIRDCRHTRIPVYDGSIDTLIGILHMKKVAQLLARDELDRDKLLGLARAREPYYVPEGTPLNLQLLQFQRLRRRVAFIVDEYGDVQGLVTLEDLLEEIVGEFTSGTSALHKDVHRERPDSFVVNASASVRTLNRKMGWSLPATGPRTLNGLIVEYLETIPDPGTSMRIGEYSLEILQTGDNAVKTVRLKPITPDAGASDVNQVARSA